ncbi:MAG: hypothetical protein AAF655_02625 [Bacteroidota bacterium]
MSGLSRMELTGPILTDEAINMLQTVYAGWTGCGKIVSTILSTFPQ